MPWFYALFRVEGASDDSNSEPMDMEQFQGEGDNDSRDEVEGSKKQDKSALAHSSNAGGSINSDDMNGKGGGQGVRYKVSTFLYPSY
jgi:hypothetical protein